MQQEGREMAETAGQRMNKMGAGGSASRRRRSTELQLNPSCRQGICGKGLPRRGTTLTLAALGIEKKARWKAGLFIRWLRGQDLNL
jgi:hypothetical protein